MSVMELEVIVVGAGVVGSATAYYLASRGTSPVLLLEQFDALNVRGSSHGGSRVNRFAFERNYCISMLKDAHKMWSAIEEESGKQLYHNTGILVFGEKDSPHVQHYIDTMRQCDITHEVFTGREAMKRYPHQLKLPDDYCCVMEHEAGILKANKSVATLQELFVGHGGQLLDNHRVTRIIPGPVVTVETEKTSFRAKRVIVTAGPWTNKLLQHTGLTLPLKTIRSESFFWATEEQKHFSYNEFPAFCGFNSEGHYWYGTPTMEYSGLVKICTHGGIDADPDKRDNNPHSVTVDKVQKFIESHFKGVNHTHPAILEYCMITKTPDRESILDKHPKYSNIIIGAGFSGHGFKEAPVVGKILSELALDLPPSHDISHFTIARFAN